MTELTALARVRQILAGSIGNLVEWYDWYAYSAAALYFAPVFFPHGTLTEQLLQSAAIFAVGFFARPVGAWAMGLYADRAGRRAALTASVALMCAGSLVIALTPGAAMIGMAAPAILVLARLVQGLSLGGQYGAAATYMSEVAGKSRRGLWSSFTYVTLIGGQLVAVAVMVVLQQLLSPQEMTRWGWRVPFLIGALLAFAAFRLQTRMAESQSFLNAQGQAAIRTRQLFRQFPRETLTILGLSAGGGLIFYVSTTYMQKYLVNSAGFSKDLATQISALSLLLFMLVQPLFGYLSDRIGRKTMLLFAFGGQTLTIWPLMLGIAGTHSAATAFLLIAVALLFQSGYTAISAVVKAELFPTHARGLGVALPYAIANALFGGTAEYVALWFKEKGIENGFYVYVTAMLAIAVLAVLTMPRHSRIVED